jgi:hypothetical protein
MNRSQSCISSHIKTTKTTRTLGTQKQQIQTKRQTMVDTYKVILVCFMSFLKEHKYDKDYEFSQLGEVSPIDDKTYMCYRAYGTAEPGPDDQPLPVRSSSLFFWKKTISHFMPNRLMSWNALAQGETLQA